MRDCNVLLSEEQVNELLKGETVSIEKNIGHGVFKVCMSLEGAPHDLSTKEALEMPKDIKKKTRSSESETDL